MQEDICNGKFVEYGEYKGNLYGTSSESVSSLVNAGYMCLLNPHYQALKMLRTPQLRPYIIYVKPPRFEILKETRNDARARSTFDESNSRGFTVSCGLLPICCRLINRTEHIIIIYVRNKFVKFEKFNYISYSFNIIS